MQQYNSARGAVMQGIGRPAHNAILIRLGMMVYICVCVSLYMYAFVYYI